MWYTVFMFINKGYIMKTTIQRKKLKECENFAKKGITKEDFLSWYRTEKELRKSRNAHR